MEKVLIRSYLKAFVEKCVEFNREFLDEVAKLTDSFTFGMIHLESENRINCSSYEGTGNNDLCETPHGVCKQRVNNSNTNISGELLEAFVILSRLSVVQIESLFDEEFFAAHAILKKGRHFYKTRITKAQRNQLKLATKSKKIAAKDEQVEKSESKKEKMSFVTPYLQSIGFEFEGKSPKVTDLKRYVQEQYCIEDSDPFLKPLLKEDYATIICCDVAEHVANLSRIRSEKLVIPLEVEMELL
jgi:uncharacterized protein (DUF2344 family)